MARVYWGISLTLGLIFSELARANLQCPLEVFAHGRSQAETQATIAAAVAIAQRVIRHQSGEPANRGPLSSRCSGYCGLASAIIAHQLANRGLLPVSHQMANLIEVGNARHGFLYVPVDTHRGYYVDVTLRQFNTKNEIRVLLDQALAFRAANNPIGAMHIENVALELLRNNREYRYRNTPLGFLANHADFEVRQFAISVLRDGYAELNPRILAHLAAAFSVDQSTGHIRPHRVPSMVELTRSTSPGLLGEREQDFEYTPAEVENMFQQALGR